ncbi:hypothetical protein GCM10010493_68470 [Streptomyces lavendulae subsp. grasserius]
MSGGQTKLAEHPVLVVIGVIATIIGAVAAGKDLFSSEDPPPGASAPAVPGPASTPGGTGGTGGAGGTDDTPAPSATRTRTAEPEQDPETTEPGPGFPRPETGAPTPPAADVPSARPSPPPTRAPCSCASTWARTGRWARTPIGPGPRPAPTPTSRTRGGRLDRGCYVQWTLKRGDEVVQLARSERCRPPSITLFNFDSGSLGEVGSYTLTAEVTTDWNQTASGTATFEVVPR